MSLMELPGRQPGTEMPLETVNQREEKGPPSEVEMHGYSRSCFPWAPGCSLLPLTGVSQAPASQLLGKVAESCQQRFYYSSDPFSHMEMEVKILVLSQEKACTPSHSYWESASVRVAPPGTNKLGTKGLLPSSLKGN